MDLHPGETIVFEGHPSWRSLLAHYIGGTVVAVVVAVVIALALSVALGVVVGVVLWLLVLIVGFLRRTATDYLVTNQRLYIRHGILSKHVQQTRIDRVQNVNTDQSLPQRLLMIGTVDFDTAGTDDSDFRFVGIGRPGRVAAAVDRALRDQTTA